MRMSSAYTMNSMLYSFSNLCRIGSIAIQNNYIDNGSPYGTPHMFYPIIDEYLNSMKLSMYFIMSCGIFYSLSVLKIISNGILSNALVMSSFSRYPLLFMLIAFLILLNYAYFYIAN